MRIWIILLLVLAVIPIAEALSINEYDKIYIEEYDIFCSGNEALLCPYMSYELIYDGGEWNKTVFNISSPLDKFTVSNVDYILPSTIPLKLNSDSERPIDIPRELKKRQEATINPTQFELGDRMEYIFELPANTRWAKFGDNSIVIIQKDDVSSSSLLTNATAEGNNFTHLNPSAVSPYDKLLLYMPFDGDKEDTMLTTHYDYTGNYDGTGVDTVQVTTSGCKYDNCANFSDFYTDGTIDYISTNFGGSDLSALSFSLWFKTTDNPVDRVQYLLDNSPASGGGYIIRISNDDLYTYILDASGACANSKLDFISPNEWHHMVFTYNLTYLTLYVDGADEGYTDCIDSGMLFANDFMDIGADVVHDNRWGLNGSMDEIMAFNAVLTPQQVTDIYNNQSRRFVKEGIQRVTAVNISSPSNWNTGGTNTVNLTVNAEMNFKTNVSARIGMKNASISTEGLLAYYPLEWCSGRNIQGDNYDGITTNVKCNITGGLNGSTAIDFGGRHSHINITNIQTYNHTTISAWVRFGEIGSTDYIISKMDNIGGLYSYALYHEDTDKFGFFVSEDGVGANVCYISTQNTYTIKNHWYHVVGLFNGTNVSIYVDGIKDTLNQIGFARKIHENTISTYISGTSSSIGSEFEFNGTIDEVMIYNRSLTDAEILTLYQNKSDRYNNITYTPEQNITASGKNTTFNVTYGTDWIFPELKLLAVNETSSFYTPIIRGEIILNDYYIEDAFVPATINISNVDTSEYINVTQNEYFTVNLTVKCLTGTCGSVYTSLAYIEGWNVSTAVAVQTTPTTNSSDITGLFIRSDGLKMYTIGLSPTTDYISEYDLSVPFDISTTLYIRSFAFGAQDSNGQDIFFKPQGDKMYMLGNDGDDVNEYTLTTPWDISSHSFVQSFSVNAQESAPTGMFFSVNGTKMYIVGNINDNVNEYKLSTAWDVSTSVFVQAFDISVLEDFSTDIFFRPEGTKMYISGNEGDEVHEFNLSRAWDISTATYTNLYDATPEETNPNGISFSPNGSKMYIAGAAGDDITEYNLDSGGKIISSSGTPFYTNSSNPQTTSALSSGASEVIKFYVNATGPINTTYKFYSFANTSSDQTIYNTTANWYVTITKQIISEEDTCTAPSSGDWTVDCSDNCAVSTLTVVDNLFLQGIGNFYIYGDLYTKNITRDKGCVIFRRQGADVYQKR